MTIYLDSEFICHLTDDGTMTAIETDDFDGQTDAFIEGYRYVPEGETWTRSDGVQFKGLMIAPAKNYLSILADVAISYLDDTQAETVTELFPKWQIGVLYKTIGTRLQYNGKLYKVKQAHTSQADWTPDITPALYEVIDATHSGTIDDPIPFETGMAIEKDKYYTQYEVEYLCIRDSINPLYNDLSTLISIYVEVVQ